ncbi:MAG: hypothetical protein QXI12_07720 [Candidatus Methanomethyliaceae archaeon]
MRQVFKCFCIACVTLNPVFVLFGCSTQLLESMKSPILTSSIPTPMAGLTRWTITPDPGKAILRGRVIVRPHFLLGELYLGKAVPTSDPNVELIELDENSSPRAIIDRTTGEFIFLNVEPGKYGIIAWEPMKSILVNDPETGSTLFVILSAGQVKDIGTIFVP